jgi:hypothetical protein
MKKRLLFAFPLLSALGCSGVIETEEPSTSPNDPSQFSARMFNEQALEGYSETERAYVKGHALGVYLYGKTLPPYLGHRGYSYKPGVSSGEATVPYDWDDVMVVYSGGTSGNGDDDVVGPNDDCNPGEPECDTGGEEECDPFDPECETPPGECDPFDPDCNTTPPGECDPFEPECNDPPPPEECDPFDPECEEEPEECDPFTEDCQPEDCEDFLNPAALRARELRMQINEEMVLANPTQETVLAFKQGLSEALYLQDLAEDTSASEVEHLKSSVQEEGLCEHSPLVLDLNGDGLAISNVGKGVKFDLLDRGNRVKTAWIQDDDALLVLDLNNNGRIDSGSELFGNNQNSSNGFASLATLDSMAQGGNGDGVINQQDLLFAKLQVWNDSNRDGESQASELRSLNTVGIVSIDLAYETSAERDENGNSHRLQSQFIRKIGDTYTSLGITDVWFKFTK